MPPDPPARPKIVPAVARIEPKRKPRVSRRRKIADHREAEAWRKKQKRDENGSE